jgi:hypothetical protein
MNHGNASGNKTGGASTQPSSTPLAGANQGFAQNAPEHALGVGDKGPQREKENGNQNSSFRFTYLVRRISSLFV